MNLTNRIFNIRIAFFAVLLIGAGYLSPPANAEEEEWKLFLNETPNESWYGYEVRCFLEDGEYMWVGTGQGLVFKVLKETLEAVDTLEYSAYDMTYDREGNIMFAGRPGLMNLVGDSLIPINLFLEEIGLSGVSINSISIDSTGKYWLNCNSIGLIEFDGEKSKLYDETNAPFKRLHPFGVAILSIAVDKNNNIWTTAAGVSGVLKYDHQNWTLYDSTNSVIKSSHFEAIAVNNNNEVWVGSSDGLYKYDGSDWLLFDTNNTEIKGKVFDIAFDKDNNLWCTYGPGGLISYDGDTWKAFNQSNSLIFGNFVSKIYVDQKQNIWFSVTHDNDFGQPWKGRGVNIYRKGGVILEVNENILDNIFVNTYPNPVNDYLSINSEIEYFSYEVLDLRGISVLSGSFVSANSIDVSSLVSGTYCLKLISGQSFKTVFFIKY